MCLIRKSRQGIRHSIKLGKPTWTIQRSLLLNTFDNNEVTIHKHIDFIANVNKNAILIDNTVDSEISRDLYHNWDESFLSKAN